MVKCLHLFHFRGFDRTTPRSAPDSAKNCILLVRVGQKSGILHDTTLTRTIALVLSVKTDNSVHKTNIFFKISCLFLDMA